MIWKTEQIVALTLQLVPLRLETFLRVETRPGEDCTTQRVLISINHQKEGSEDTLLIQGFSTTQRPLSADDSVEIEHIEITDTSADSSRGIQTLNEELAILATRLRIHLTRLGWSVVPNMENFF